MSSLEFWLIVIFATYRLTNMLNWERGLFGVFDILRKWAGIQPVNQPPDYYAEPVAKNELGKAILCFACLSVWVALLVYMTYDRLHPLWIVLAISGATMKLGEWRAEND